jgi:hypothetical protein
MGAGVYSQLAVWCLFLHNVRRGITEWEMRIHLLTFRPRSPQAKHLDWCSHCINRGSWNALTIQHSFTNNLHCLLKRSAVRRITEWPTSNCLTGARSRLLSRATETTNLQTKTENYSVPGRATELTKLNLTFRISCLYHGTHVNPLSFIAVTEVMSSLCQIPRSLGTYITITLKFVIPVSVQMWYRMLNYR